jgi:hypothetical protein
MNFEYTANVCGKWCRQSPVTFHIYEMFMACVLASTCFVGKWDFFNADGADVTSSSSQSPPIGNSTDLAEFRGRIIQLLGVSCAHPPLRTNPPHASH